MHTSSCYKAVAPQQVRCIVNVKTKFDMSIAGIATSPYGTLPNAPNTALTSDIPELRTGLSARPPSYLSQRAVSLLSARPVPSRPIIPPSRLGTPRPRTPRFFSPLYSPASPLAHVSCLQSGQGLVFWSVWCTSARTQEVIALERVDC